ncbi:Crp/Fnr family transcriptional regulator [Paenibacillus melissococcoides]|uniref:Crp/Fnr family transcriptional regulator n=1 Tax=Paenibacillus melissococcoides TaxID=2912268 RepID=A0ABM9G0G3_9BACL|nr:MULTISPECIES: Crp/Fnr family transcriptional regulator [Paenibacillus]MEB9892390.1 Crp/Fnr family transcriptional regulator [Bacillus cereus]CAH8245094.1 Crp/Fnr family transcriptional regulator [Paenibacillus melissococcoides]CAH8709883.1 Crp/Fnr family transcriptional regulator [Paenibacillus melissococcoides]CAH8710610.1 Crp/Fnr family transcriptional regulator [Paenibacillus melissococcoides]
MTEDSCQYAKEPCTRKVPIFASLSDEELAKVSAMIKHRKYEKGEALVLEEQPSDTLFIIKQGHVKLLKVTPQGKEQILHILSNGDFFGELNIFNSDELSNFSAYALKKTDICMFTRDDMEHLVRNNPDISWKLLKTVTKRLAHTENLAQSLATKDPEIRIAYMILELGNKYGKPVQGAQDRIKLELPLSREELANYVGVTRETISRKFSKFERLGIIEIKGTREITILNVQKLNEYID